MMSATYEQHQLPTSFTFRIVEIVKKIRIQPMPRATALPWGMSVAAGFLITVLSLSPHLNMLNIMGAPISSSLPGEARVLETGEIRVDILKASQLPVIANNQENSNLQPRELRNAFLMAPQAEGGTWTTKADMSTSRWGAVTCVVDGKIYAIGGGTTPSGKYFPTLEVYDPDMDTWTTKADMPTARNGHAVSVVNGRIYVIGGEPREKASIPTVEEYDPTTDTWTKKADMPTKRTFPSTAVVHGKIYAIGGVIAPGGSSTPAVEMYDPATDTWTTKANMPTARSMAAASTVDGKIYVIGGVIGSVGNSGISTVEEYDPATDIWTKKTNMPTGRKALSTSVVDRKIYAIGGARGMTTLFSAVEVYDPATDSWMREADMPTARCLHSTSAVDGNIYSIGGSVICWPWTPTATVEAYNTGFIPLQEFSSVRPKAKLPTNWGQIRSD